MTDPTFTILMPVVRPPDLMPFAIDSILRQTRGDFELFIISDGAPAETVAAAETASKQDGRIRVFRFPKGERLGEAHRHTALAQARGRYVCQLGDDDLWLPEHLEQIASLLTEFEFGHLLHINMTADEHPFLALADLADPVVRAKMAAEVFNFFNPSAMGFRMESYRRLPVGWSPAPQGLPTDLFMWRKFLALPGVSAGTRFVITSIHFPSDLRREWPMERRREEIARYSGINSSPAGRDRLCQQAWTGAAREHMARHEYMVALRNVVGDQQTEIAAQVAAIRSSWSWRLTAPLRGVARLVLGKD